MSKNTIRTAIHFLLKESKRDTNKGGIYHLHTLEYLIF